MTSSKGGEDSTALAALISQGNARASRRIKYFIYVPDQLSAEGCATVLRQNGFSVESRLGADGVDWLVLAYHAIGSDPDKLEQVSELAAVLAQKFGGEFDGWEADV